MASPTFGVLFDNYYSIDVRPYTGQVIADVFSQVKGQPFWSLVDDIKGTPSIQKMLNDF